jgi:hypothetical protein
MFKANTQKNEELDRAGRLLLMAASGTEEDADAAASSPFLFTRVRAAISEERQRREESGNWLSLILVARRAVPAMAMVALLAAILTAWSAQLGNPAAPNFDEDALFETPGPGVEQTVLADASNLSQDDVFNIVVERDYGRNGR